jgi:hypothetical protein
MLFANCIFNIAFNLLNMKNIFILISIVLFLSSCDKPIYHNIPKNEKPLLKDKDTVVFIDRINNKSDSFLIRRTDDYRVSDKRFYQEEIIVKYHYLNESRSINEFGFVQTSCTNINITSYYLPSINENDNTININVNGIDYQSIFVQSTTSFPDSLPSTVYYSYKYGIIRYDYSDGRYYELNSKIQ